MKKRQSGPVPRKEGSKARRLVTCAKCGWRGRRLEDGGLCGKPPLKDRVRGVKGRRCMGKVRFGAKHAPKAPAGEIRVRMTVRVLESTTRAISPTQAAVLLDAAAALEAQK